MTIIDFTRSLPPVPEHLGETLADALRAVATGDVAGIGRATRPAGRPEDRIAAARWLRPRFAADLDAERIVTGNGTQSLVIMLLQSFVPAGKTLVAESLSYGMLRALADIARVPVQGLPIDGDGLLPDALESACRNRAVGAIYCNPTFHNPTASVMSEPRRLEIASIARRHGIPIIEDDPIGLLHEGLPRPIAALAPDCTWFIATLTKTIAQGMRVAYMVCPSPRAASAMIEPYQRLSHWVAAPLMAAAATWLIETGHGQRLRGAIAEENLAREACARRILPQGSFTSAAGSPHIWLPLEADEEERLSAILEAKGVIVRGQEKFRVDDQAEGPNGLRLSLSSPLERASVIEGLHHVAAGLAMLDRTARPEVQDHGMRGTA